jgi:hypothetical protein
MNLKFKTLFNTVLLLVTCSCTDEGSSRNTLESAGYTDITFEGHSFFLCGQDDVYSTKFTAVNPRGIQVSGAVCCGLLFKGCTIRY